MSIFDSIGGGGPRKPIGDKSYEFGIRCDECGSFETEAFPTVENAIFDVVCEECGHTQKARIPFV